MSARNLFPVAVALAAPVSPALPRTSMAGVLARTAALYRRLRARLR